MLGKRIILVILVALVALSLILGFVIFVLGNDRSIKILFLDVGQGDAVLITQGSNQVLIDGGPNEKILLEKLGRYLPFWDRTIEAIIASHPDQDHIGGLIGILERYEVNIILETAAKNDSETFKVFQKKIQESKAQVVTAKSGVNIKFPSGSRLSVLHPFFEVPQASEFDSNDNSIVARLEAAGNSFLFTADLPMEEELALIGSKQDIESHVLKVAHHGSKYSTSGDFLAAVKPRTAVVSVGKENKFGHPSQEVLERLSKRGIEIYRTDEMGDIIYECWENEQRCVVQFR